MQILKIWKLVLACLLIQSVDAQSSRALYNLPGNNDSILAILLKTSDVIVEYNYGNDGYRPVLLKKDSFYYAAQYLLGSENHPTGSYVRKVSADPFLTEYLQNIDLLIKSNGRKSKPTYNAIYLSIYTRKSNSYLFFELKELP